MRIDKRWLIAGVAAVAVAAGSVGIATAVDSNEPTGPGQVTAQTQDGTQEAEDGQDTHDSTDRGRERPDSATAPDAQRDVEREPGDRTRHGGERPDGPRGPHSDRETGPEEGGGPRAERGPGDGLRDERGPGAHHREHDREHPDHDSGPQDTEQDGTHT
ncbi:hypothetical protein [Rhodococcus sp. 105337]|uniref:hypothetical protein n=1 Tax=Rhodococcus sp. 105337 TaxID=2725310 RepID=UPI00146C5D3D|nr:hypothetical protein [Rhodococcus sp. 105337]NME80292.1 hypothetical protein [Rhodococcus sp. 105337]